MESNLKRNEKKKWCGAKSKRMLRVGTSAICQEGIDHAHRTGMEYTEKNSGKKAKSIIVKFKSWRVRKKFYDARPKNFKDGEKKPGTNHFLSWLTKQKGVTCYSVKLGN